MFTNKTKRRVGILTNDVKVVNIEYQPIYSVSGSGLIPSGYLIIKTIIKR